MFMSTDDENHLQVDKVSDVCNLGAQPLRCFHIASRDIFTDFPALCILGLLSLASSFCTAKSRLQLVFGYTI